MSENTPKTELLYNKSKPIDHLNVSEANQLRSEGHKSNVKFVVVKNTLVKLAFKGTTYEGLDDYLTGPTMLGFSYDEPGAEAKILRKYSKSN